MSNAPVAFPVIRRCDADLCEPGCNCDRCPVVVDVDELTAAEVARFEATGTAAQRAEIAAYFAPVATVKETRTMKNVAPKPYTTATNCTGLAVCNCSECAAARLPTSCPAGCPCLVCLVDGLSANPAPRRAA
jgi:hypothetical protein